MFKILSKQIILILVIFSSSIQPSFSDDQFRDKYPQHSHETNNNWAYRILEQYGTEITKRWFDKLLRKNGLTEPVNYDKTHFHPPGTPKGHRGSQTDGTSQRNYGKSCGTQYGSCQLMQPLPVSSGCWCPNGRGGQINGQVY